MGKLNIGGVSVQKSTVVESIQWRRGWVEINVRGPNGATTLAAARVLITVPLGVLQARTEEIGAIRFLPDLPESKQNALSNIAMGKVIRVTLRFQERFWEKLPKSRQANSKTMAGMSFLFSPDAWFPTWWTMAPKKFPLLVGWAPFHCAARLSGQSKSFVVERSTQT